MVKKTALANLCTLAIISLASTSMAGAQFSTSAITFMSDSCYENKEYILGAVVVGLVAIPTYLHFTRPLDPLDLYYNRVSAAIGNNQDTKKFIEKFSPPPALLRQLIEEQSQFTPEQKKRFNNNPRAYNNTDFGQKNDLIYIKQDKAVPRIICAYRMKKLIEKKSYTTVDVPKKYFFLTDRFWVCVAEKITTTTDIPTTELQQMKEISDIALHGYTDFQTSNWIMDANHKLFFIDTEIRSFFFGKQKKSYALEKLKILLESPKNLYPTSQEAIDYLESKISQYQSSEQIISLPLMKDLDNDDINNEEVQKWLARWNFKQSNHLHTWGEDGLLA